MKVCTDSCIFGASVYEPESQKILDIGTGTGLLALMVAQRNPGTIDAIEIDSDAAQEARNNVSESPWSERIHIYNVPVQEFGGQPGTYDLILTNPPFFTGQLQANSVKKNTALHSLQLAPEELASAVSRLLAADGKFYIMLPPAESAKFEVLLEQESIYPYKRLLVKENAQKNTIREITAFSRKKQKISLTDLPIRYLDRRYTPQFQQLLQEYYTIF